MTDWIGLFIWLILSDEELNILINSPISDVIQVQTQVFLMIAYPEL